jgi:hypothetical protein
MRRFFGKYRAVVVIAALMISAAGVALVRVNWSPPWREEHHPRYQEIKRAFRELSTDVLPPTVPAGVTNFGDLAVEVARVSPQTRVEPYGANPFPGVLPAGFSYGHLASWKSGISGLPLVWGRVDVHGPIVVFVDVEGHVREAEPDAFQRDLQSYISQGLASTNAHPSP